MAYALHLLKLSSRAVLLTFLALTLCLAGCQRWNWRGRGFEDDTVGWTGRLRPPADSRQFTGLDTRAQEIERNLGVR